jgi:hypothetical protein
VGGPMGPESVVWGLGKATVVDPSWTASTDEGMWTRGSTPKTKAVPDAGAI